MLQRTNNKYYIFWVCVWSLGYPTCNADAPYCQLWYAPLYPIYPRYFTKGKIFGKSYWISNCV